MTVSFVKRIALLGAALLVSALASPGLAGAQDATLYEVSETMKIKGGAMARRVAYAALVGTVNGGTPICPTVTPCQITAFASDNVNLATGKGPVNGTFAIVVQDDPNMSDGPEVVVFQGSLVGKIDLSPALLDGQPIGLISGTWTARGRATLEGTDKSGTFTGIFRLPFPYGGVPSYLLGPESIVPVGSDERSLNTPLVRLELQFQ